MGARKDVDTQLRSEISFTLRYLENLNLTVIEKDVTMQNGTRGESQKRRLSVRLLLGIVFLPYIFAWFTLRKGYSRVVKVFSLGWLVLLLIFMFTLPDPSTLPDSPSKSIASPEDFNEAIPLLKRSDQDQKVYADRIDYIWSGITFFKGSTEKLVSVSDYGRDGVWETLMTVFPVVIGDADQSVEGMGLAAKLIQVACFAQGNDRQIEEINDWTRLVATYEGNLDSEGDYNGRGVKFSRIEFPDGNAIVTLVIGEVPESGDSNGQKELLEEDVEVDYSLIEKRFSNVKVLEPEGRFITALVDGYLRFMSPDESQEYFVSESKDRIKPGKAVEMIHFSPGGEYLAVASGLVVSVYDVAKIRKALFEGEVVTGMDIIINMVYAPGEGVQLPDESFVSNIEFSPKAEFIKAEILSPDSDGQGVKQSKEVEVFFN
jgi:hypothetical protein